VFETNKGPGEQVFHDFGGYYGGNYGGEQLLLNLQLSRPATVTFSSQTGNGPIRTTPAFQWNGPSEVPLSIRNLFWNGGEILGFITPSFSGRQWFQVSASDGHVTETASCSALWIDDPSWLPNPALKVTFRPDGVLLSWDAAKNPEVQRFSVSWAHSDGSTWGAGGDINVPATRTSLLVPLPPNDPPGTSYFFNIFAVTQYGWSQTQLYNVIH
jgi:hypothetical protein